MSFQLRAASAHHCLDHPPGKSRKLLFGRYFRHLIVLIPKENTMSQFVDNRGETMAPPWGELLTAAPQADRRTANGTPLPSRRLEPEAYPAWNSAISRTISRPRPKCGWLSAPARDCHSDSNSRPWTCAGRAGPGLSTSMTA